MEVVVFVVGAACRLDFVVADGGRGGVRPWRWSRSDGWHESGRCISVASWSDGDLRFVFDFLGVYDLSCAFGFDLGFERLEMICAWEFDFWSRFGEEILVVLGMVWRGEILAMNKFRAAARRSGSTPPTSGRARMIILQARCVRLR
uniref:Uncharacterized protein n=1 Tax=Setaria italica TaxID=4555 RepID=K3XMZ0_SETIT